MSPRLEREGREWLPDVLERRSRGGRGLPGPLPSCRVSRLEAGLWAALVLLAAFLLWVLA